MSAPDSASGLRVIGIAGTYYRFHQRRYFHADPRYFYKNFIDTRGGFESAGRFAPARAHCGHYFGGSEEVALAETLYYEDVRHRSAVTDTTPLHTLQILRSRGNERVFLAVSFEVHELLDLTDAETIDTMLRTGSLRAVGKQLKYEFEYFNLVISPTRGGNSVTDTLGIDARARGYAGVLFPSVRSLVYDGDRGYSGLRFDAYELAHLSSAAEMDGTAYFAAQQLKVDRNIVVFSGAQLTSAISKLTWLDTDGNAGTVVNPFHGAPAETIERARLRERNERGLGLERAAREGLLSEQEAEELFTSVWFRVAFDQAVPLDFEPGSHKLSQAPTRAPERRKTLWSRVRELIGHGRR